MLEKTFPATLYCPTQPRTGDLQPTLLRLGNMILVGENGVYYLECYKGSLSIEETIPTDNLTGTISIGSGSIDVIGSGTAFSSELRSGQRFYVGEFMLIVNQIADDTHCTVYVAPTSAISAATAERAPVIYEIQGQRGTQTSGRSVESDKGAIIGAGFGTVRINGDPLDAVTQGSAGPTSVGTGADSAAVGTQAWTNPGGITASGGGVANCIPATGVTTHYLKGTNCGFAVPVGATIVGIQVEIRKALIGATTETVLDSSVKIVKASGAIGTQNKASATAWLDTLTYSTYGSSSDLWGETWTPADINDVDFGVVISATTTDPGGNGAALNVDHVRITVYYTETSGNGMVLDGAPMIAVFDQTNGVYTVYDLNPGMQSPTTSPTTSSVGGGAHNMQPGNYTARLVSARTATNGYTNPGPQIPFTITTIGDKAKLDFSAGPAMDTVNGSDAWDFYSCENIDSLPVDVQGPWNYVKTVTAAELVAASNLVYLDFANSEINRNGPLDYNNDPPPPCGYVAFLEGGPVWISCRGKLSDTFGPSIRPSKPRNVEAAPADWDVTSTPPQNILGVTSSLARLYFPTAMSLQQGVYLGSTDPFQIVPSVSMRPYWRVGFNHENQLSFVGQDLYGWPHQGPTRSVADAETVSEQFFGQQIAEIVKTWNSAYMFSGYDPQLDAICYFHSADSKNEAGFWRTRVVLWGLQQNGWIGDLFIESDTRDMNVCGVAEVSEHLYFLAGGRFASDIQVDTFEFNTGSGDEVPYYAAWSGISHPSQNLSVRAARMKGKVTDGLLQVYGWDEDEDIDYAALEAGTGALIDLSMSTTTGIVRKFRKRFNAPNCGLAILRLSGTWSGNGDPDQIHSGYMAGLATGNRR